MRTPAALTFLVVTTAAAGAGAATKPPTPSFGKSIDAFASYDAQDTCDPTAKPGAVSIRDFITETYPSTGDYGITRACNIGGTSEHKEGRAWDWKVSYANATQKDIANTVIGWLLDTDEHGNACAIARRMGMMYFIWNSNIWGAYRSPNSSCATAGWKAYTGSNPHTDHVHFSWSWAGAKKQTSWWSVPAPPPTPTNQTPKGYLDGSSCERVWGWSQDPDAPNKSIDVHLYFGGPAGDPSAKGVPVSADVSRDDLCSALGSCNHAFEVASPLSLHDGQPHAVHAYGIDSAGGENAQLAQSPATLECDPVVPSGIRRRVADMTSFEDWGFSEFWDVMPLDDADLAAIGEDVALPDNPLLVKSDDGSPEVWLIDGELRRHVPSMEAFDTWGFDSASIVSWSAKDLEALTVGPQLRDRPFLVQGSGDAIYLIDDALPKAGGRAGSGGSSGSGGSGSGGIDSNDPSSGGSAKASGQHTRVVPDEGSGCACRSAPSTRSAPSARDSGLGLALLSLAFFGVRRRRQVRG